VIVDTLSSLPLERQVTMEGATWLDRQLVGKAPEPLQDAGFGRDVREALEARRRWLVAQELASEEDARTSYRPNLLSELCRREVAGHAQQLSGELGLGYREAKSGEAVEGVYRRSIDLVSGRYALIEKSREFTLVPWRPVLERAIDKPVSGIMRGDAISWTFGKDRAGPSL